MQRPTRRALLLTGGLLCLILVATWLLLRFPLSRDARLARLDVAALKRDARAHPTDPLVFHHLAERLRRSGEPRKAFVMASRAYELNDRDPRYVSRMAGALVDTGQAEAGRQLADFASTRWPDRGDVRAQLSRAYAGVGRFTDALREAETAVRLAPESAEAWRALGAAHSVNKHPEAAYDAFKKALSRAPSDVELLSDYGEARAKYGDAAGAERLYRRAVALAPGAARPLGLLGTWLADRAPTPAARDEARSLLARSLAANPSAAVEFALGRLELQDGRAAEAVRHLEACLRLDARFGEAYLALGQAYRRAGDASRAATALQRWRRFSDDRREMAHLQQRLRRAPDDPDLRRRWIELTRRRKPDEAP